MSSFIVILEPNKTDIYCDGSLYARKKVKVILEKSPGFTLSIHTPLYQKPLKENDIPTEDYPSLILNQKLESGLPEYYLVKIPDSEPSDFIIFAQTHIQPDLEFGTMCVRFPQSDLNSSEEKDSNYFFEKFDSTFPYDHSESKLYRTYVDESDDNKLISAPIDQKASLQSLFEAAENFPHIFECKVSDAGVKKIKHRSMVSAEIVSTEQTYVDDLTDILTYWMPKSLNSKIFSDSESEFIFRDVPRILNAQKSFLELLKSRGTKFNSIFSDIFIEFSTNPTKFKAATDFIASYADMDKMCHNRSSSASAQLLKLAEGNKTPGRGLASYLVTVVQRIPRYILFVRELIKCTPKCHPECEPLSFAFKVVENLSKEIYKATITDQAEIKALQARLGPFSQKIRPTAEIIQQSRIQINKPTSSPGVLYLYNDYVSSSRAPTC